MLDFYTPCKREKTKGFLAFSGGLGIEHRTKTYTYINVNRYMIYIYDKMIYDIYIYIYIYINDVFGNSNCA